MSPRWTPLVLGRRMAKAGLAEPLDPDGTRTMTSSKMLSRKERRRRHPKGTRASDEMAWGRIVM
jgi:hypothetical protein